MEEGIKTHHLASQPVYAPFIDIPGEDIVYLSMSVVIFLPLLFLLALFWHVEGLFIGFVVFFVFVVSASFFLRVEFRKRPRKGVLLELLHYYFISRDVYTGRR